MGEKLTFFGKLCATLGPTRRYIVRPEKNYDNDDNDAIWAMHELKKNNALGMQLPFVDPGQEGEVFEIRPANPTLEE